MINLEQAFDRSMEEMIEEGFVEYKKKFFGKDIVTVTIKGKEYLENCMHDKLRYIQ